MASVPDAPDVPDAPAGVWLRPYAGPADLAGIGTVRAAVRAVDGPGRMPGPDDNRNDNVGDDPGQCLLAGYGDRTIGYTWRDWWTEADRTRLYLLLGWVDPTFRRRGVGGALLARQEAETARLAARHLADGDAGLRPGDPLIFGANADDTQPAARDLLLARGYRVAFTVVHMARDLTAGGDGTAVPLPRGLELRPVTPDQHPLIHDAIEECFAVDAHGYSGRSYPEYLRDVEERQWRLDLWCVAWDGAEVAGVVVNELADDGGSVTPWVAVRPAWRRLGVAHALLREGHARLAAAGATRTRLETVAENVNDSVGVYRRAGYEIVGSHPRYRKPLAPAGAV